MKLRFSSLPEAVRERLLAIQANPSAFEAHYQKAGGRGGAIVGLVFLSLSLLAALALVFNEYVPLPAWLIGCALIGVGYWAAIGHIRRFNRAPLRPMLLLNPLYLVRVTLDRVSYYALWKELKDLRITHHHTNGVYQHTAFTFTFEKNRRETFSVRGKALAEALLQRINGYRRELAAAMEAEDMAAIAKHDIFIELRLDKSAMPQKSGQTRDAVRQRRIRTWALGGAIGALAGLVLGAVNYASAQERSLYCYSLFSCQGYFDRWMFPLYTEKAQRRLVAQYQREWTQGKNSARKLRKMMSQTEFPHLTDAQHKQVAQLYGEKSKQRLHELFEQVIERYQKTSGDADPRARAAILAMLRLARDKDYYRVKIRYQSVTSRVDQRPRLPAAYARKQIVPMGPSFTETLNRSRESEITRRIGRAFGRIIPRDIMEFPGSTRSRYGYGYRSKPAAKPADEDSEIEFRVHYAVFPSGSVYFSRRQPEATRKYYTGVGFEWRFQILEKDKVLYAFERTSYPPARFSVSSYRSRYGSRPAPLATRSVYSAMARTAFDNFGNKILTHFGVPNVPTTASGSAGPGRRGALGGPGGRNPDYAADLRRRLQQRLKALRERRRQH